jgi:hypothetical protein
MTKEEMIKEYDMALYDYRDPNHIGNAVRYPFRRAIEWDYQKFIEWEYQKYPEWSQRHRNV